MHIATAAVENQILHGIQAIKTLDYLKRRHVRNSAGKTCRGAAKQRSVMIGMVGKIGKVLAKNQSFQICATHGTHHATTKLVQ
jgi:hypothetical protein